MPQTLNVDTKPVVTYLLNHLPGHPAISQHAEVESNETCTWNVSIVLMAGGFLP